MTIKEINDIRKYYPGDIGGEKIAKKANNNEVEFICDLNDRLLHLRNEVLSIARMRDNLIKKIERR